MHLIRVSQYCQFSKVGVPVRHAQSCIPVAPYFQLLCSQVIQGEWWSLWEGRMLLLWP